MTSHLVTVGVMYEIRTIGADDLELFRSRVSRGFGGDIDTDDAAEERFRAIFDYERTLAAFDGDDIIGTASGFSLGLTVPGGLDLPMGGTTIISVQPTHRRKGVLRALMDRHLEDVASREEPLAGLWASETPIYGRFGYGPATLRLSANMSSKALDLTADPSNGTVRLLESDKAESVLKTVYEQARTTRPGMLTRSEAWWTHRRMADPESGRGGKSAKRHAIFEEEGTVTGYASYRQQSKWEDFISDGEVEVIEVITTSPAAHTGIWAFLTSIDLFPNVAWWNMPIDDPLPFKVSDQRRVARKLIDGLWVRVMDVSAALSARSYDADGVVSFRLEDSARPETSGTYRLEVENGVGECERVAGDADLAFETDVLGSLYLGGGDAMGLAAAGRIEGDLGSVSTLHRLFRTDTPPWCPEVF